MKYINIPKSSDTTIDLAAITGNYKGIIIAYKEGMAVGRISYCSDTEMWYFCDNIADNFRLLEFYTNNDD
jgi:hypothetical protein